MSRRFENWRGDLVASWKGTGGDLRVSTKVIEGDPLAQPLGIDADCGVFHIPHECPDDPLLVRDHLKGNFRR